MHCLLALCRHNLFSDTCPSGLYSGVLHILLSGPLWWTVYRLRESQKNLCMRIWIRDGRSTYWWRLLPWVWKAHPYPPVLNNASWERGKGAFGNMMGHRKAMSWLLKRLRGNQVHQIWSCFGADRSKNLIKKATGKYVFDFTGVSCRLFSIGLLSFLRYVMFFPQLAVNQA